MGHLYSRALLTLDVLVLEVTSLCLMLGADV